MPLRFVRFAAPVAMALVLLGGCGGEDEPEAEVGDALASDATTTSAPSDGETTTTTARVPEAHVIEVRIVGGAPEGGVRRAEVKLGERVVFRVTSDVDEEIHIHGYDIEFPLVAGQTAERAFDATIPGVFEVELHGSGREILKLQVS